MGPLWGFVCMWGLAEGEVGGLHSGSGTWKLWIRKPGNPETRQSGNPAIRKLGHPETPQSGNWGIGESRLPAIQGSWVFMFFMWTCAR